MDSTVAKELRDAGFPPGKAISVSIGPTLSELIEACGEKFYSLTCVWGDDNGNERWEALCAGHVRLQEHYKGEGATPTEAVARLWLALNRTEAAKS